MAVLKCKMCGGDLNLMEGASTAECEYCGSVQTVPKVDDEKKLTLFGRANRLRAGCDFDKAAGIYETIVADFPAEAEAYWGLVLCKYGIEYVDDPATGKKIPTCHRSSFDSVMDDSDFEQALENADIIARKVYRDEAKQIEEIRKGIIAVSANEDPYDIFICYKETDGNGERTLDSVLAQDIYDKLIDKGYRVFFSRITLEDKLGMEYEPYIFAALNSAPIMLVFGTDYEYFNAVWVKNEWSRYLKLMAQNKEKHLIPCFKGIDAYDMPKEFARLQAQDLGKVGADQDLLRGIEKLLPRQKEPVAVVQERVVIGGSGDNKIASLLDRGNMALDDGDWEKADSFFEDVLNNDSKNAQAYLGKTMAQEKCRTIDALIRSRKNKYKNTSGSKLYLQPDNAFVDQKVITYAVPGYVEKNTIRKLYEFPLIYRTDVPERKQQYSDEEKYWATHKQLSRAEQFATGAVAERIKQEKAALFAELSDRIKRAEADEAAAKEALQQQYKEHLENANKEAEKLHAAAINRLDSEYRILVSKVKKTEDIEELKVAAKRFEKFDNYQESKSMAAFCRRRIEEEQLRASDRQEQQRVEAEKARRLQEQQKAAKKRRVIIFGSIGAVLLVAMIIMWSTVIGPMMDYSSAEKQMADGYYLAAAQKFEELGDYRDSKEKVLEARYGYAEKCLQEGKYSVAIASFKSLGDYKDAPQRVEEARKAADGFAP